MAARRGFTLVEVLAAMLLIGIVMPVVMQGVTAATRAASTARHRTEAATLAEGKLQELVVTNGWQNGSALAGDFGGDWPGYQWKATLAAWANDVTQSGMQELDVQVSWTDHGQPASCTVCGLVYVRPLPST